MLLKFLTGEPALVFNKNLVIADLHIGIETEFRKGGIIVPTQIEQMKGKINNLIKKTKAKRLVIIGDVKDQVPGVSLQELREVPEFFNYFSSKIETHICLGNHDSEIPALVENVTIHDTDGFSLDDAYITHGHSWPKKEFLDSKYLIISHTHPLIEIRDKLGYRFLERVWIKSGFNPKAIKEKYFATQKPLPKMRPFSRKMEVDFLTNWSKINFVPLKLHQKHFFSDEKTCTRNLFPKKLHQKEIYKKIDRLPEIILMSAFNWLCGGVALNSEIKNRKRNKEEFFGPLTKLIDKKQTEIFLLDGTFLGKLEDLKNG